MDWLKSYLSYGMTCSVTKSVSNNLSYKRILLESQK